MCSPSTTDSNNNDTSSTTNNVVLTLPKEGGFARWRKPALGGLAFHWVWYATMYALQEYFVVSVVARRVTDVECLLQPMVFSRHVVVCFLYHCFSSLVSLVNSSCSTTINCPLHHPAMLTSIHNTQSNQINHIHTIRYPNKQFMEPRPEFCTDIEHHAPCRRSDLMAFQLTSCILQFYMGGWGIYGWHLWRKQNKGKQCMTTPATRTLGRLTHAEYLCVGILAFQVWDFMVSWTMVEHRNPEFLVHHVLTALTAYLALEFQMMHYYSVFFGGCSEISSMALVWIDVDRYFVGTSSAWTMFIMGNQAFFVVTFVAYRIVGWIAVSVTLWRDVRAVLPQPATHYRPGKLWFMRVFLFLDVALGSLQVYWFVTGLMPKIMEVIAGDAEPVE